MFKIIVYYNLVMIFLFVDVGYFVSNVVCVIEFCYYGDVFS